MKIYRRLAVILLALLMLPLNAFAADCTGYDDVPEDDWSYEYVMRATELGLVGGVSPGHFGFGQEITRAQYSLMLCRLMGWEMIKPESGSFSDNQNSATWYYSAVETAYAHGVLPREVLGDELGPNEPLPREEMAAMTVRALGFAQLAQVLAGVVQNDCPFVDVTSNKGYITLGYHMGFMGGVSPKYFSPKTASTREQAATVLLRVYDKLHAEVETGELTGGKEAVKVDSVSDPGGRIPMYPRAPLENVYDAAIQAGSGGAVALCVSAVAVEVRDGKVQPALELTANELAIYRREDADTVSYSARFGSSYLVHTISENDKVYVWFESEEDLALKVELCRMLGVSAVYTFE
ncbi:MAG: S-layer homology domain-containing protein [Oscillospiraceae bacterium]|nr:S-layer homology domain-containing protein [Oscillospiraceae bacterium]